jgi:hypothetical protein
MHKTTIDFGSRTSLALWPGGADELPDLARQLALPDYDAVLAVIGSAGSLDPQLLPRLAQLFGRGVARAAQQARAVLVDGGTQAGVMALLGEAVAGLGGRIPLVGVAPASLVSYPQRPAGEAPLEPHHSHFVLTPGLRWGDETKTLLGLVQALATQGQPRRSAAVLLVGGGQVARAEVLQAVRLGLPLVVLTGSGGLADELAAVWPTRAVLPDDPLLAEILADGRLRFYPLQKSVEGLENTLLRELGDDPVLLQAWEAFADYDHNANRQQRKFDRLQRAVIGLGVATPALVVGQQLYAPRVAGGSGLVPMSALWQAGHYGWWALNQTLILVPITLTLLVAVANQFKQGNKWLLLRAAAESVKREIYRYRARAMYYADGATPNAPGALAQRLEEITRRTMRTEVNTSSLQPYDKRRGFPPYSGPDDDGLAYLSPARYVQVRLDDQFRYFRGKAVKLERQLRTLSWVTFIVGAVGTYLAAIDQQVWIALTTALVAGIGTFLSYRQVESTLGKYNQAAADLANVRAWWQALPPEDRNTAASTDSLVEHTEQVLQLDLDGWVQQMQNALAELHKNQARSPEREEDKPLAPLPEGGNEEDPGAPAEEDAPAGDATKKTTGATTAPARPAARPVPPPPAEEMPPGGPRIAPDDDDDEPALG